MDSDYAGLFYYINSSDLSAIVETITALLAKDGLRRVPRPPKNLFYWERGLASTWAGSVAVIPGADDWSGIKVNPCDLLCLPYQPTGRPRFVEVCAILNSSGFILGNLFSSNQSMWGNVLLETDGKERLHGTGWWSSPNSEAPDNFYGVPLNPLASFDNLHAEILPYLERVLARGHAQQEMSHIFADTYDARLCYFVAEQFYGKKADYIKNARAIDNSLHGELLLIDRSVVCHFESAALAAPNNELLARKEILDNYWRTPRFFYASGADIRRGDVVLFKGKIFAKVVDFLSLVDLQPRAVVFEDELHEFIVWAEDLGADNLNLVSRNSET